MRQALVDAMRPLDPISVENSAYPGTPDINYADGWIECKELKSWPVRPDTIVRVDCFTQQQRVWLSRRVAAGGLTWLMLKVGQEWLLFSGNVAATMVGRVCRRQLEQVALRCWPSRKEMQKEIVECLSSRRN